MMTKEYTEQEWSATVVMTCIFLAGACIGLALIFN